MDRPGLRAVRDSDSAGLIALIGGCWAEYPGCVLDVDGEEPWLREPAAAYARKGGAMWVLPAAGAPGPGPLDACVGFVPDGGGPGCAELKNLYVAAAARRRGLGADLVDLVLAAARGAGAAHVVAWSDTRFADAHRLYERLGFARTSRTRDLHDQSGTTEYEFLRAL
jgi:GNAT superfamily N-acetyltransferase